MNLKDRIDVFDRDSKLLQEITSSYSQESEHYQALQRATRALWYVLRGGHDFQPETALQSAPVKKHAPEAKRGGALGLNRSA